MPTQNQSGRGPFPPLCSSSSSSSLRRRRRPEAIGTVVCGGMGAGTGGGETRRGGCVVVIVLAIALVNILVSQSGAVYQHPHTNQHHHNDYDHLSVTTIGRNSSSSTANNTKGDKQNNNGNTLVREKESEWLTKQEVLDATAVSTTSNSLPPLWNAQGRLMDSLEELALPSSKQSSSSSSLSPPQQPSPSQLLSYRNFNPRQTFSATWWQSVARFRRMPVDKIQFCEDAFFQAVLYMNQGRDFRLTTDWTDFAVEHLSRWWKITQYEKQQQQQQQNQQPRASSSLPRTFQAAYQRILRNLLHYSLRVLSPDSMSMKSPPESAQPLVTLNVTQQTLAVVAYLPYVPTTNETVISQMMRYKRQRVTMVRGQHLTIVSLAATLASLIRYDFGRIVIVCDTEDYEYTIQHVWPPVVRLLQRATAIDDDVNTKPSQQQEQPSSSSPQPPLYALNPENAMEYLLQQHDPTLVTEENNYTSTIRILSTELQITATPTRHYHEFYGHQKMVPRSAVQSAHRALFGDGDDDENNMDEDDIDAAADDGSDGDGGDGDEGYFYDQADNPTFRTSPNGASTSVQRNKQTKFRDWVQTWLGGPSDATLAQLRQRWKYVYLTEPDTILMSKRHVLENFQAYLDEGKIFTPHRLQPMPHEFDFSFPPQTTTTDIANTLNKNSRESGSSSLVIIDEAQNQDVASYDSDIPLDPPPYMYLPAIGPWQNVTLLKMTEADACCEVGYSGDPNGPHGKCGNFWFQCGFDHRSSIHEKGDGKKTKQSYPYFDAHNATAVREEAMTKWARLASYSLVQYAEGTRLVFLAGSEHGRMCVPRNLAKEGPCPTVPPNGGLAFPLSFPT